MIPKAYMRQKIASSQMMLEIKKMPMSRRMKYILIWQDTQNNFKWI